MSVLDRLFGASPARLAERILKEKKRSKRKSLIEQLRDLENYEEAISVFMDQYRKTGDIELITQCLGDLGTQAVIEPLIEILRTAEPSRLRGDGTLYDDGVGKDKIPASVLVEIEGGIEAVKSAFPPTDVERVLVIAHKPGGYNPSLSMALGEMGTPNAIGRLLLEYWGPQPPFLHIREALIKAGDKAHPQLLAALAERPVGPYGTTYSKKDILAVLKETGNEDCIPTIVGVMGSHPDGEDTIEAIRKRSGAAGIPTDFELKPVQLKLAGKTGDGYVDSAFQIEYEEFTEGRLWSEMPDAMAIVEAANTKGTADALQLCADLQNKCPDYFFAYYWLAILYRRKGQYDEARNSLEEGLGQAISKYNLCHGMGDLEWELGNLTEAIKWWIRSVIIQISGRTLDNHEPFLYLSYVAERLGFGDTCSRLRREVDNMQAGRIRLDAAEVHRLYASTLRAESESMKQAITLLDSEYLS